MARTRKADGTYASDHGADPALIWQIMESGEVYTTGEVADLVDAPRRTVYNYLAALADDGRINVKQPNERLKLWWKNE